MWSAPQGHAQGEPGKGGGLRGGTRCRDVGLTGCVLRVSTLGPCTVHVKVLGDSSCPSTLAWAD